MTKSSDIKIESHSNLIVNLKESMAVAEEITSDVKNLESANLQKKNELDAQQLRLGMKL